MMWFTRVTSQASVANGLALALALLLAGAGRRRAAHGDDRGADDRAHLDQPPRHQAVVLGGECADHRQAGCRSRSSSSSGFWFVDPAAVRGHAARSRRSNSRAALILLIFAYGGYEVTGVLAGEAANPRRDVPFAFVATLIIVSVVMSLTSLVATGVLPDLGATPHAAGRRRRDFHGRVRRAADVDRVGRCR